MIEPIDDARIHRARILLVDDEPINVRLLEETLRQAGYTNLASTTDAHEVQNLFYTFTPDLVVLDLLMPRLDGYEVMAQLKEQGIGNIPILVLTADTTMQAKRRALLSGAKDFLTKPFDTPELLLRIGNLLETRFLHQSLERQKDSLALQAQGRLEELEKLRAELEETQLEVIERLARASEFRDNETNHHTQRVAHTGGLIAEGMGQPHDFVQLIRRAAPLHDVGKIAMPDTILFKPGELTPEERKMVKWHTTLGAKMLSGGRSRLVQMAESIARSHHEWWDGGGYPQGLAAHRIPLEGRIVAVADVFDCLTHDLPYHKAWDVDHAVEEIRKTSERQFDPAAVEVFLRLDHGSLI